MFDSQFGKSSENLGDDEDGSGKKSVSFSSGGDDSRAMLGSIKRGGSPQQGGKKGKGKKGKGKGRGDSTPSNLSETHTSPNRDTEATIGAGDSPIDVDSRGDTEMISSGTSGAAGQRPKAGMEGAHKKQAYASDAYDGEYDGESGAYNPLYAAQADWNENPNQWLPGSTPLSQ